MPSLRYHAARKRRRPAARLYLSPLRTNSAPIIAPIKFTCARLSIDDIMTPFEAKMVFTNKEILTRRIQVV
jgi:hypothetical protein